MDWTPDEYARLADYYRDQPDEALLALAGEPENLTPIAEEALRAEIRRRGLPAPGSPEHVQLATAVEKLEGQAGSGYSGELWGSYAALAPEECRFYFEFGDEGVAARRWLEESGIESFTLPSTSLEDGVCVVVKPSDADRAGVLLAQPIPERLMEEPASEVKDFVAPSCPACGSPDSLLESADPTNQWLCEECDHTWADPPPAE
jgi:hypothetical protein